MSASHLDALSLSAFMSSKICHDLVGPVGAIRNGLELLEEEEDEETRAYALQLIQSSAHSALARLDFARLAFGASMGLGGTVELGHAERIARAFIEEGKHRLHWRQPSGELPKDEARLILMLLAIATLAIPGGGDMKVVGDASRGAAGLEIRCQGKTARIPDHVQALFAGQPLEGVDPRAIIPYYAARLAEELGLRLGIARDGAESVITVSRRG